MATTWSSGMTFQYGNEKSGNELANNSGFTFVDFMPQCRTQGGLFSSSVYETFRTLIDRANEWLRTNKKWKVVTCESVEFKAKGDYADSTKMTYVEYGEHINSYLRGLRLWLTERAEEAESAQQIGYMNLMPRQLEAGGIFTYAKFETLDAVIERYNSMLPSNPLPGRVITIESQEMKVPAWDNLDPDRCNWRERGDYSKHYVFVIRIFYEIMTGNSEEIGFADFLPNSLSSGGIFTLPEYEPFWNVIAKASDWCLRQEGVRFCNAQSLEIKVRRGKNINTNKMSYIEYGNSGTFYARILRVAYTKPSSFHSMPEKPSPLQLTCKTFLPVQVGSSCFMPEFENLFQTKERVNAWIKASGARVLSAETAPIRISWSNGIMQNAQASCSYNRGRDRNEYWVFVFRLYLSGVYQEPPPEMLPPVPEIQDQGCCVVT